MFYICHCNVSDTCSTPSPENPQPDKQCALTAKTQNFAST